MIQSVVFSYNFSVKEAYPRIIEHLLAGEDLPKADCELVLSAMFDGSWSQVQVSAFLTSMRWKGAAGSELAHFATAMLARAEPTPAHPDAIDLCGTGGGHATFNMSTAAAFVVAATGQKVVKHGNRGVTSSCGSADILERIGVGLDRDPEVDLTQYGLSFLFAPKYHPALKAVGPIRRELGFRTIFNQLGPLANPARVEHQIIGVYEPAILGSMAEAAQHLGRKAVWVVHSSDGLDEISPCAPTAVMECLAGEIRRFEISPADWGAEPLGIHEIQVRGEGKDLERAFRMAQSDPESPYFKAIAPTCGAALLLCGRADSLREGVEFARSVVAEGKAAALCSAFGGAQN